MLRDGKMANLFVSFLLQSYLFNDKLSKVRDFYANEKGYKNVHIFIALISFFLSCIPANGCKMWLVSNLSA